MSEDKLYQEMLEDSQRSNIDDYFELKLNNEQYIKGLREDTAVIIKDAIRRREQFQQDIDWLKDIVKAYDPTAVTVPTAFDSKIEKLRLYLNKDQEQKDV